MELYAKIGLSRRSVRSEIICLTRYSGCTSVMQRLAATHATTSAIWQHFGAFLDEKEKRARRETCEYDVILRLQVDHFVMNDGSQRKGGSYSVSSLADSPIAFGSIAYRLSSVVFRMATFDTMHIDQVSIVLPVSIHAV